MGLFIFTGIQLLRYVCRYVLTLTMKTSLITYVTSALFNVIPVITLNYVSLVPQITIFMLEPVYKPALLSL